MVEVIDVHGLPMISAYLKESKDVFIFSARALVPGHGTKLMVLCSLSVPKLSFVQFAPSADTIFAKGEKKLTVSKSPRNQRKTRAHRDPVPTEYKVETLYSGTVNRARILARVLQQRCVRISAHKYCTRASVPGNQGKRTLKG